MANNKQQQIFTNNLNHYLQKVDKTQREIATKIGVSPQTFNTWCQGIAIPRMGKIQALADYFGINKSDLIEEHTTKTKLVKGVSIPILNTVVAGMPIDAYEDILGYEEISTKLASTGEFFALRIKGDSMLPVLQENDIVIVRQQSDIESGDIAIVLVNGDTATVKKVMKQDSGITMIAFNPAIYEPHFYSNAEIESLPILIAGKVVEMKRSF